MKFKFCSDGDCPLWALAGLNALGSLPAGLFKNLLQQVVEEQPTLGVYIYMTLRVTSLEHHLTSSFECIENIDDAIKDILKDTSLSSRDECARAGAVIRWVVRQALACACPSAALARDLLVLGVPRSHANALAEVVDSQREGYVEGVKAGGFMINKLTDISATSGPEGSDTVKLTLHSDDSFTGEQSSTELVMDKSQAKDLLEELKKAKKKMDEIAEEC